MYNVGQQVRVKKNLIPNKYYNKIRFSNKMCSARNKCFRIVSFYYNSSLKQTLYTLDYINEHEEYGWIFNEQMIEEAYNDETLLKEIIYNNGYI